MVYCLLSVSHEWYSNVNRLDWNDKGGIIMLFVKDNCITFPVSGFCFSEKAEIFCLELNFRTNG